MDFETGVYFDSGRDEGYGVVMGWKGCWYVSRDGGGVNL